MWGNETVNSPIVEQQKNKNNIHVDRQICDFSIKKKRATRTLLSAGIADVLAPPARPKGNRPDRPTKKLNTFSFILIQQVCVAARLKHYTYLTQLFLLGFNMKTTPISWIKTPVTILMNAWSTENNPIRETRNHLALIVNVDQAIVVWNT